MAEIISTWIRSRLGVIIDLTAPSIGNCCRDGTFYAKLLHSYAVINESQLNTIIHTSDPALARVNLRHLQVWLRFIGVDCDRKAIEDISNGKGTAAFHLLYKIYLCLENKDCLHFITLEKEREKYVPASTKFDVRVVPEEPEFDPTLPEHPLFKLLEINTQLSNSHKEDVRKMLTNYLHTRHSKVSSSQASEVPTDIEDSDDGTLKTKPGRKIDKKELKKNAKRKMMKELDDFAEKHADVSHSQTEEPYEVHGRPEAAKQYIEELKARRNRDAKIDQRNKEIQNNVLKYFWDKFEEDQENHFDKIIASVVLRQSDYEKKMVSKLCEIRRQKNIIAANRQMVNEMMFKAREDHMRLVEESKREMKSWDDEELEDEVRRFNELQKRLQDEQEEKMRYNVCKIARDVANDLINLAVYSADSEVPRGLWNEWKSLFIKGLQIFPSRVNFSHKNILESKIPEVISEYHQENALIDKDLCDYIDINAPWNEFIPEINQENKEFIDLGGIVLGYVVNKLLQESPQAFLRPKLPDVKVRAILLGVPDSKHSMLQDLLKHKKISMIQVEDAINYCLQCYKDEKKDEDSVEELKFETDSELSTKSPLGSSKGKDNKVNKKTQTPRVIPFDDMHPTLSDSACIGEWIHRFFVHGEPISDELMSKVIFEYLRSFDNIKGWVLINYPDTYRQLAFLELSLSGKPLSNVDKVFSFNEDDVEDYEFEPQIMYTDSVESCRESKLLPNPLMKDDKYNSCLNGYIRMIEKPKEVEVNAEELFEIRAEDATRIDNFYRDQGIAQVVYYDECDSKTLKRIARLLIGDIKVPRKSSEEMFGSKLRNIPVKSLSVESSQSQECKAKPGEINWTWVNLPLNFEAVEGLVSLWRNCESAYVCRLKNILALRRSNLIAIIPYKDFVYNRVISNYNKDGLDKQELVQKFKEVFNCVIERGVDKVVKKELRDNVKEFQMELWEICDAKRLEAEEERKKIVLDDWTLNQVIVLVNIYVTIMQIEMDRFVDTLQFLRNYYLTMLQRTIEDNIFKKIILDKCTGNIKDTEEKYPILPEINNIALKKGIYNLMLGVSDNMLEEVKDHCLQIIKPIIDYAQSSFEDLSSSAVDDLKKEQNFKLKRRSSEVKVKNKSERLSDVSVKSKKVKLSSKKKNLFLEWEYALMYEINRVKMRLQIISSVIKVDLRFLLVNIKRGFSTASQSINERYKIEIENVNDLIKLFEEAIDNECIIKEEISVADDCFVIPKEAKVVVKEFSALDDDKIDDKFRIEQLCYLKDVFQSVEPHGIISKVSFVYILQDLVTCEEEDGETEEEEEEEELKEGECLISSLPKAWFKLTPQEIKKIIDEVFEDDIVDWREFIIYALDINLSQDAMLDALDAFKQKDNDKDQIISRKEFFSVHLWPFNLESEHEEVKEEMFEVGNFNINSDDLKFKNEEIGDNKEAVSVPEEINEEEIGRLYLMKLFVCDMFSSDDNVNYMDILLAFCKDDKPIYGFGKALSVFLGQKICMDYDEGEKYVASMKKQYSSRIVKRKARKVSKGCMDDLIDCIAENFDKNSIKLDGSVDINIEITEPTIVDQENMQILSSSDKEDLKFSKSDEEDMKFSKSDEEDLLLYYNENYYDEQCHDIVYFNAGGHRARRKSTRKMVYWISIDLCESVLTALLPRIVIENVEESTGVSLKENLRVVSSELRCKDTKINRKFVLAHRLIHHDFITKMLESTNRFTFKNLSNILREIIKAK